HASEEPGPSQPGGASRCARGPTPCARGDRPHVEAGVGLMAVSRYGARVLPNTNELVDGCQRRGELIQGPQIAQFERAFATRLGAERAVATSYGRMGFYYILKALDLPPGSEIIFPSMTFWVVPEIARVCGLKVVFADIDPETYGLDPVEFERAITPR